ncbi:TatD family deoxyribonuclease [Patescibacteria group bacterium]|nr:MAG: TatD family deoxyribonuclease [Patescibacteria group bacterium]
MVAPKLIDSHCHLQFQAYREDAPKVIEEALHGGTWPVVVGTQSTTSAAAVELANRYPQGVYAAVGLHPNHLHQMEFDEDELPVKTRAESFDADYYAGLAKNSKVVAIGECGLDFYRLPADIAREEVITLQKEQFRVQLNFADAHDLPVIIHCRDAHKEILEILTEYIGNKKLPRRGVIHSFTAGWPVAGAYLDLGFYLGFNGIITFPPRKGAESSQAELIETVKNTPADKFLFETDAPYLSPVPERGRRNHPNYIAHVAGKAAQIRGVAAGELAAQSVQNAQTLFYRLKI